MHNLQRKYDLNHSQ